MLNNLFKRRQSIYNFDDRWYPELISLRPTAPSHDFSYYMPDEFYSILRGITVQITSDANLGDRSPRIFIHRGHNLIFTDIHECYIPGNTTMQWGFYSGCTMSGTRCLSQPRAWCLPSEFVLLPNDRIQLYIHGWKGVDTFDVVNLSLKRWNF